MSKFSTNTKLANKPVRKRKASAKPARVGGKPITNLAGGRGYTQSSKLELASLLLTSFLQDEHYRSAAATQLRLKELVAAVEPEFAAKAAVYARDEFGMRSTSHVVAAEIARTVKGADWTKRFFNRVVLRPDDVTEILALYMAANKDAPIPNSLKRGLGLALARFDEYRLAKYRGESHAFKLVNAVNLLHPKATAALNKLMTGALKPADTWETKLSQAGQTLDGNVKEEKAAVWKDLLANGKLGYLAALRNIRNILEQGDSETVSALCALLVKDTLVRDARIFPMQVYKAYEVIEASAWTNISSKVSVLSALSTALDISVANVPPCDGPAALLLDTSGSMRNPNQVDKIGAVFAAAMAKAWAGDFMSWSDRVAWVTYNRNDSVMTIAGKVPFINSGTNLSLAFNALNRAYDRVVVLSDMQTWLDGSTGAQPAWRRYCATFCCKPHLYSFDLKNYGQMAIPEDKVYCIAGWSDKVFDVMGQVEDDREALVHAIEAVSFDFAAKAKAD